VGGGGVVQAGADEIDVTTQDIKLLGKRSWNFHLIRRSLNLIQAIDKFRLPYE